MSLNINPGAQKVAQKRSHVVVTKHQGEVILRPITTGTDRWLGTNYHSHLTSKKKKKSGKIYDVKIK